MNKLFRILSIDGGGIRGVYSAYILKCIEERLGVNIYDSVDMFAGTSTGAIITAGLALNKEELSATKIYNFYMTKGRRIFKKKWFPLPNGKLRSKVQPLFHSIYDSHYLNKTLTEEYGDTYLEDIHKPLLITATDIANGYAHLLRSNYERTYKNDFAPPSYRDANVKLKDAVLASCAAPSFFDPHWVKPYLLADGGLWANNPALCAIIEAQKYLQIDIKNIRVLSIGTGSTNLQEVYGIDRKKRWGIRNGWGNMNFLKFFFALQSNSDMHYLQELLGPGQLTRINYKLESVPSLDITNKIREYVSKADQTFTNREENIWRFFH